VGRGENGGAYTGAVRQLVAVVLGVIVAPCLGTARTAPPQDRGGERWVKRTLARMTLDEKIGQVLVPSFESTYLATDSDVFERLAGFVRNQHVGGVIAFGGSQPVPDVLLNPGYAGVTLGQPLAAAATFNRLQALSPVPLLAAADFEWGVGMRIAGGTSFPRAMAFGAAGDERLAAEAARITAIEARALGVRLNFAPVADVNNNARNPVINTRSFGATPAAVSTMVASYVRSLQEHGMIATLKHFPGHGDTDVDSHLGLPLIPHPRDRLDAIELPPFRRGIEAGAGAVMTSHIALSALEPQADTPATFSAAVVSSLLRRQIGFDGLVLTDSMKMAGVARLAPPGEAAVRAFQAGHDMLLDLPDPPAAFEALRAAVARGDISETRLTDSVARILIAKARLRLHENRTVSLAAVPNHVGGRAHRSVAQIVSERSITLLKDEQDAVPLRVPASAAVLYLSVLDSPGWSISAPSRTMEPEMRKRWPQLTAVEISDATDASALALLEAAAERYAAVIASLFVRTASGSGRMDLAPQVARTVLTIARRARESGRPFVSVFFGNPYVAAGVSDLPAMLLAYDISDLAELNAVRAIAGETPIGGRLPIALPGLFPIGHGLTRQPPREPEARSPEPGNLRSRPSDQ
jgi:beta-N-acetylhexosaminidase